MIFVCMIFVVSACCCVYCQRLSQILRFLKGKKKKSCSLLLGKTLMKIASSQKALKSVKSLSLSLVTKLCPSFAIPWTVACRAPLSMGSSRQEYKSGLPFPSPLQSLSSAKITFITGGFSLPCSHWEGEWYSAVSAQYRQVQPE